MNDQPCLPLYNHLVTSLYTSWRQLLSNMTTLLLPSLLLDIFIIPLGSILLLHLLVVVVKNFVILN